MTKIQIEIKEKAIMKFIKELEKEKLNFHDLKINGLSLMDFKKHYVLDSE